MSMREFDLAGVVCMDFEGGHVLASKLVATGKYRRGERKLKHPTLAKRPVRDIWNADLTRCVGAVGSKEGGNEGELKWWFDADVIAFAVEQGFLTEEIADGSQH